MDPLFFDLETTWMAHDAPLPTVTVGAYAIGDGPVRIVEPDEMLQVVGGHRGPIVGHNLAFDLANITNNPNHQPWGSIYDTHVRGILRQAASGEHADTGAQLKDLAKKVGYAMPAKDKKVTRSFGAIRSPDDLTPLQRQYVIDDVEATRAVFNAQGGLARQPDEERQTELSLHVFEMARRGVHIDVPYRDKLLGAAGDAVTAAHDIVRASGIIQPRGPKKDPWRDSAVDRNTVQARLRAAGAKRLAAGGKLLAADDEAFQASGDPALVALATLSKARKHLSLVEAWGFADDEHGKQVPIRGDIIRAWWKPIIASGRISCAWPNITQVPKKGGIREIVTARPGNKLVIVDFAALEFRVWAATVKRWIGRSVAADKLWEESRGGQDVHTFVAGYILQRRPNLTPFEARQLAKALNYGVIGGMGEDRCADALGITVREAAELLHLWKNIFYEYERYQGHLRRMVDEYPMYKVALPGSGRIRKAFGSECMNYVIQGGGADVTKDALRLAHLAGLPVVALVHDELILDVPEADAKDAAAEVLRVCEQAGQMWYPEVPWNAQKADITDRWHSKS